MSEQTYGNRIDRRENLLAALKEEPLTKESAMEIIEELAALGIDIQRNPPDFGSAEWYSMQPEEIF